MYIYIVKTEIRNSESYNLGVHSSKRKANDHFDLIKQYHLNSGKEAFSESYDNMKITDNESQIRRVYLSYPTTSPKKYTDETLKIVIEKWKI